ncbi:MAG: hypothetical protein GC188_07600 [Alphaproteobacteria bacterium]|nr:hypothetical protein [Alphaproteobacteria bacterium]
MKQYLYADQICEECRERLYKVWCTRQLDAGLPLWRRILLRLLLGGSHYAIPRFKGESEKIFDPEQMP